MAVTEREEGGDLKQECLQYTVHWSPIFSSNHQSSPEVFGSLCVKDFLKELEIQNDHKVQLS